MPAQSQKWEQRPRVHSLRCEIAAISEADALVMRVCGGPFLPLVVPVPSSQSMEAHNLARNVRVVAIDIGVRVVHQDMMMFP